MSVNSFFPTTEVGQLVWLTHYSLKLPVNKPLCGINAEEITQTQADILYYLWLLQEWHPATQRDAKEATAYKQLMIGGHGSGTTAYPKPIVFPNPPPAPAPGIQKRLSSQIARIKARLNYNEAIGKDLGVIAIPDNVEHGVPEFWLTVEMGLDANQMRIDFTSARTGSIGRLATSSAGSCGFCPQSWRLQLG